MKLYTYLLAAPLCLCLQSAMAQSLPDELPAPTHLQVQTAENLFQDTKEIYFQFTSTNRSEINAVGKFISIDHIEGSTVKAFANKKGFLKFLQYNISYSLLKRPNQEHAKLKMKHFPGHGGTKSVTAYPTYPEYVSMMQQFAIDHPSLCRFYDLGTLPSGRKMLIVKISDNPDMDEDEPEFLYTSTMHGDETTGYPVMLDLIEYLLNNYGTDPRVTNLVNNIEIWINPLANPDGTYAGGDATVSGATRYNANAIDLNRNYPDPQDGPHPDGEVYQPETQIWMGFADTMNFVMSANFHGGAEVANYAWDTKAADHADKNWWVDRCVKFADTCQVNGPSGYFDDLYSGTNPGVTNGYAWYEVNGGRQDYMHWWHQCREMTLEVSTTKLVAASTLDSYWNSLHKSLLNYIQDCMYGIRGIITDQCTGQPIRAKVFISGHDFDSSFVYSALPVGDYHRMIYPGTYNVTYSATGYQPVTLSGINVVDNIASVHNVQLQPLVPVAGFMASSPEGCTGTVSFTDLTGSGASWSWDFGDGQTSTEQNPVHTYTTSGTYTVTLTVTNCAGTDSEIKNNYVTLSVITPPTTVNDTSTSCSPASLNLSASGGGTLNWYDAPTGGTLVNTGTGYTTPVLSATTTYYVESMIAGATTSAGATDNTMGTGGYFTGAASHYEIFDALQPFTLLSVTVYSNLAGNRTIELRNSGGTVLQSTTVNIGTGTISVPLNFNVPTGSGFQLGISGTGGNLYRNSSGASYPYTLPGVLSITGNSAANLAYYYFFYNWQVQTSCTSARIPVSAVISGITGTPAVSISASDLSVCPGTTVNFTATPTSGGTTPTYQWTVNGSPVGTDSPAYSNSGLNNGDVVACQMTSSDPCATTSTATNNVTVTVFTPPTTPVVTLSAGVLTSSAGSGNQWYHNGTPVSGATGTSYTPASNGTYYVIVTDANGCTSDTSNVVTMTTLGMSEMLEQYGFELYPNPAETSFMLTSHFSGVYKVTLIDNLGQNVWTKTCDKNSQSFDVSSLKNGLYFVQVSANGTVHTQKIVIR